MNRKLPKLNNFPDIYDVQIFMMICINYGSVNVWQEQKVSPNTICWPVSTKNVDVRIG